MKSTKFGSEYALRRFLAKLGVKSTIWGLEMQLRDMHIKLAQNSGMPNNIIMNPHVYNEIVKHLKK
jgi:hypothetical protein